MINLKVKITVEDKEMFKSKTLFKESKRSPNCCEGKGFVPF